MKKFFVISHKAIYFLAFALVSCGAYMDSRDGDHGKRSSLTASVSAIRTIEGIKGSELCYAAHTAVTALLEPAYKIGTHDVIITKEVQDALIKVLGYRLPELDSYATAIIPDLYEILLKKKIIGKHMTTRDLIDWDFGGLTVGSKVIFFSPEVDYIKPFYTKEAKARHGIPLDLQPTPQQAASFAALLAHELAHIVQAQQPRARDKISKSCVLEYSLGRHARYDYSLDDVHDLFLLGQEASAEIVQNAVLLYLGYQSSVHDLGDVGLSIDQNRALHMAAIARSTGL